MGSLEFLYKTVLGRVLLRPLVSRPVSAFSGTLMDARWSKILIRSFVKKNGINTDDYLLGNVKCFNDFFCRRIKDGRRPVDMAASSLISPCDGLLSAYKIDGEGTVLNVKQSTFNIDSLLRDRELARRFDGGYALVYRLCVDHYHRYIWFDSGHKLEDRHIQGVYHTVRPVALYEHPVFIENTRDYSVIDTANFGRCVQMEVGAMLVGRIVNEKPLPGRVRRGEEKGHFEYGGSTIIVLVPQGVAELRGDLTGGEETPVKMGEQIGSAI